MTKKELLDWVNSLDDDDEYAVAIWCAEDVLTLEGDRFISSAKIIDRFHHDQDCTHGLSWGGLEATIRWHKPEVTT